MTTLDSRSWLAWGVACIVPLLVSRHPILILTLLCIVVSVRAVCTPPAAVRWRWIARIALLVAGLGVIFNTLTVRTGNQIWFHLPVLEWAVTWNAVVYGLVSGLAMLTLVLTGITVAAGLDWTALTRVLPRQFGTLAASGSVAWAFLPGASLAVTDIREAQAARGHEMRSARDLLPIVVPLLDTSLSRALTISEALEARGFGATLTTPGQRTRMNYWMPALLIGALVGAYALAIGDSRIAVIAGVVAVAGLLGVIRTPNSGPRTTRYRQHHLSRREWIVILASATSLGVFLVCTFPIHRRWRLIPIQIWQSPYPIGA